MNDDFIDNVRFTVFVILALAGLMLVANVLAGAHKDERDACIKAGYEWSATKYVCVVNLKKK